MGRDRTPRTGPVRNRQRNLNDGQARYIWADLDPDERDYVQAIAASLRQAQHWRTQYDTAKQALAQQDRPPDPPVDNHSATTPAAASVVA